MKENRDRASSSLRLLFFRLTQMNNQTYQGHGIELDAEEVRAGEWVARATIVIDEGAKT